MNTIGTAFRLTLFGTSHGPCIGCVVDGCPPGLNIDEEMIQKELDLRKPDVEVGTARMEDDRVQILSGVINGITTGAPITLTLINKDVDSSKYEIFRRIPRPGHADYPALMKYGKFHDLRGGGQFSGRMTAAIVAAGAIAKELLRQIEVRIAAYTQSIGKVSDNDEHSFDDILNERLRNSVKAANSGLANLMKKEILNAKEDGDSIGGIVKCVVVGLPVGVGEPFFDTLEGELAKMIFAIPAVKGIEFGAGFRAATMRGSEHNDPYVIEKGRISTLSNNAGGVLGGLSIGMPLVFRVAFKPTASIRKEQRSINIERLEPATLKIEGRHDPCIVPRAVVVVEAATAIVLADLCMRGGFID
ncbi:MAG: chorismate synthase [Methanomassiliicoccales archaeon]|jgi:chorismate synthase|nr:chorismate synthase [Methanomassiliicoccales archaeon]